VVQLPLAIRDFYFLQRFQMVEGSDLASYLTLCRLPTYIYIQGVSRLDVITAGGDFLGLCDEKS
jgi:hypothetical protein